MLILLLPPLLLPLILPVLLVDPGLPEPGVEVNVDVDAKSVGGVDTEMDALPLPPPPPATSKNGLSWSSIIVTGVAGVAEVEVEAVGVTVMSELSERDEMV